MNNVILLSFLVCSIFACKSDDSPPPLVQYEIQAYESGIENLFVKDTIVGMRRVNMTPEFIDLGKKYKENQFPQYLEESVFRSFAFVNDSTIQVTIKTRNTDIIEKKNYLLTSDDTLEGLPDFYYNRQEDYFIQCFGLRKSKAGPVQSAGNIYNTIPLLCDDRDGEALASELSDKISHLDTLMISYIYLPFRKS